MTSDFLNEPARGAVPTADGNGIGTAPGHPSRWRRFNPFGREKNGGGGSGPTDTVSGGQSGGQDDDSRVNDGPIRRNPRDVVPGLPRTQTFKRQRSEVRNKLEPVRPTPAERRAVSVDRRVQSSTSVFNQSDPRTSAPDFMNQSFSPGPHSSSILPGQDGEEAAESNGYFNNLERDPDSSLIGEEKEYGHLEDGTELRADDAYPEKDRHSETTSQYDAIIHEELERIWVLNLSMHFRDKSKREKFFVTYRQTEHHWRRVTVSLDYRNAPDGSLEMELAHTKFQREKSAKIYEAIRESLPDIQFYDTVTNLKLQTTDGRLHVHVVEDVNEIISYPSARMIQHTRCKRVKESEMQFEAHMSGFVYKVRVNGQVLIKKEIPGPDTVDEFLYEINALNALRSSRNVIDFYGVVVDDKGEHVRGILISYAEHGALIDVLYDHDHRLPWKTREKWARQIVAGLSEIHEAGFVQGDFTLSNIVIDENQDAKIIDINRRGCPVGWEPPEATPLIECNQRISMYIGVKSDLYQLGMVLWALATQEDEPEAHGRPLQIEPNMQVPGWYRHIVDVCLSESPRHRIQASQLLPYFPDPEEEGVVDLPDQYSISVTNDGYQQQAYSVSDVFSAPGNINIMTIRPPNDWQYVGPSHDGFQSPSGYQTPSMTEDPYYYPPRGRSPPSPLPGDRPGFARRTHTWNDTYNNTLIPPTNDDFQRNGLKEGREWEFGQVSGVPSNGVFKFQGMLTHGRNEYSERAQERATSAPPPREAASRGRLPQSRDHGHYQEGDKDDMTNPHTDTTGRTAPESQADSGKDVTEQQLLASTPRGHQADAGFAAFMNGRAGSKQEEETARIFAAVSPLQANTKIDNDKTTTLKGIDGGSGRFGVDGHDYTTFSSHRHKPTQQPQPPDSNSTLSTMGRLGQSDDLSGIGGAVDDERMLVPEEVFGMDLDQSLGTTGTTTMTSAPAAITTAERLWR
ncbi:Traf2 and NCK-interacting protein kinase [Podospora australis]|uniref:Traf2 and NCK-interacting protein kinase n=1 Tax=Podospora australis TaxID=1536484 RepID=A0AAN6X6J6_9PEZI|nr:Traf2 and NCK-interacting protein kinase [Podospora australis]